MRWHEGGALGVLDEVGRVPAAYLVVFKLVAIDDLNGAIVLSDDVEVRVERDDATWGSPAVSGLHLGGGSAVRAVADRSTTSGSADGPLRCHTQRGSDEHVAWD
jgi:hypothetical protein